MPAKNKSHSRKKPRSIVAQLRAAARGGSGRPWKALHEAAAAREHDLSAAESKAAFDALRRCAARGDPRRLETLARLALLAPPAEAGPAAATALGAALEAAQGPQNAAAASALLSMAGDWADEGGDELVAAAATAAAGPLRFLLLRRDDADDAAGLQLHLVRRAAAETATALLGRAAGPGGATAPELVRALAAVPRELGKAAAEGGDFLLQALVTEAVVQVARAPHAASPRFVDAFCAGLAGAAEARGLARLFRETLLPEGQKQQQQLPPFVERARAFLGEANAGRGSDRRSVHSFEAGVVLGGARGRRFDGHAHFGAAGVVVTGVGFLLGLEYAGISSARVERTDGSPSAAPVRLHLTAKAPLQVDGDGDNTAVSLAMPPAARATVAGVARRYMRQEEHAAADAPAPARPRSVASTLGFLALAEEQQRSMVDDMRTNMSRPDEARFDWATCVPRRRRAASIMPRLKLTESAGAASAPACKRPRRTAETVDKDDDGPAVPEPAVPAAKRRRRTRRAAAPAPSAARTPAKPAAPASPSPPPAAVGAADPRDVAPASSPFDMDALHKAAPPPPPAAPTKPHAGRTPARRKPAAAAPARAKKAAAATERQRGQLVVPFRGAAASESVADDAVMSGEDDEVSKIRAQLAVARRRAEQKRADEVTAVAASGLRSLRDEAAEVVRGMGAELAGARGSMSAAAAALAEARGGIHDAYRAFTSAMRGVDGRLAEAAAALQADAAGEGGGEAASAVARLESAAKRAEQAARISVAGLLL